MFHRKLFEGLLSPAIGSSAAKSLAAELDGKFLKRIERNRRVWRELKNGVLHLEDACRASMANVRPVAAPLVLITQPSHSGGRLLNALFDGHPELDTHPAELKIGRGDTFNWSDLDLSQNPRELFETLFDADLMSCLRDGSTPLEDNPESFAFIFLPSLQRDLFLKCMAEKPTGESLRSVMDAYLTSFFGAWLNNQNGHGAKRFVTACAPPAAATLQNAKVYFDIYPEGRLISVIRDPQTWSQCVVQNPSIHPDIKTALGSWSREVQDILRTQSAFEERVRFVRFEDLTGKTEGVMRMLADFIGISFEKSLLTPTFNTIPLQMVDSPPIVHKSPDPNGTRETAVSLYRKIPFSTPP